MDVMWCDGEGKLSWWFVSRKEKRLNEMHRNAEVVYHVHVCMPTEEGLLYRARYFGDTDLYQRAQKMATPSCSRLADVQTYVHWKTNMIMEGEEKQMM